MSGKYPRRGSEGKYKPPQNRQCGHIGCTNRATGWREIQFGYMRGSDDASVDVCDDHKGIPNGDVKTWCKGFPQEAWRE